MLEAPQLQFVAYTKGSKSEPSMSYLRRMTDIAQLTILEAWRFFSNVVSVILMTIQFPLCSLDLRAFHGDRCPELRDDNAGFCVDLKMNVSRH